LKNSGSFTSNRRSGGSISPDHGANPGRIFLAAHSIREMTKDLPKVLDVAVLADHGHMRDRLDALEKSWNS
jgi:hypothetical protein